MAGTNGESRGRMSDRLRELERSGEPARLSLDGGPMLVIRDPSAIHDLIDVIDRAEELDALRESADQMRRGEIIPAEDVLAELRAILSDKMSAR